MLTIEQINLVEQSADRVYKRHISDLLAAIEWVKELDPAKPHSVSAIYEGFITDTHSAIAKYEEQLVDEILRVVSRLLPALSPDDVENLQSRCTRFIEPDLYEKRMRLFREALNRHASRYGIKIDYKITRFDLYQARYSAGTANQVRNILRHLKQELDILAFSSQTEAASQTQDVVSSSLGDAINLKPGIFGVGIDLRKALQWWREKRK